MKKYKGSIHLWSTPKIEEVEVERETDSSVWINGKRHQKHTDWDTYHDTWGEAKEELLRAAFDDIQTQTILLNKAKERITKVRLLMRDC